MSERSGGAPPERAAFTGARTRAACCAGAALLALSGCAPEPASRGVLLVLADTLRQDRLGCFGDPRGLSPNLDALADQGLRLERTYSQGCWTVPSMISMFSGRYFGLEPTVLPTDLPTLPEVLQAAGVRTAAFVGNATLQRERGFERGFDHWFGTGDRHGSMSELGPLFCQWRAEERKTAPRSDWFAWVHVLDVHHPYQPTPWSRAHPRAHVEEERLESFWNETQTHFEQRFPDARRPGMTELLKPMRASSHAYDGEIEQLDRGLGEIVAALRAAQEWESTLLVFASDHGEMFYEQRSYPAEQDWSTNVEDVGRLGLRALLARGHKTWWYEPIWRVPLVLSGGLLPPELRGSNSALHANLDLYPTICSALGVTAPSDLPGGDLFHELFLRVGHVRVFGHAREGSAVIDHQGYKLIEQPRERWKLAGEGEPVHQLFDLRADPDEEFECASREPERLAELRDALARWRAEQSQGVTTTETEGMRASLEALGYLGNEDD